jgi:hypothetical protein
MLVALVFYVTLMNVTDKILVKTSFKFMVSDYKKVCELLKNFSASGEIGEVAIIGGNLKLSKVGKDFTVLIYNDMSSKTQLVSKLTTEMRSLCALTESVIDVCIRRNQRRLSRSLRHLCVTVNVTNGIVTVRINS